MNRVHRLNYGPDFRGHKPIQLCLVNYRDKEEILRKARLLKGIYNRLPQFSHFDSHMLSEVLFCISLSLIKVTLLSLITKQGGFFSRILINEKDLITASMVE